MLGLQVKAFSLRLVVLMIVDATAFHGEYREAVFDRVGHFLSHISPSGWHGLGQGRDWSQPK